MPLLCSDPVARAAQFAVVAAAAGGVAAYVYHLHSKLRLGAAIWSKAWFSEFSPMWPGQAFSLEVQKKLFDSASDYQHIQVFDCGPTWGRVLVLDGVIQVTEKDECAYQEMMAHVPIMSHPSPKKVLVIGGGDGGVLRELSRHAHLTELHICEIDAMVVDASKKYLPKLACGYDDPRVQLHIMDGFKFMQEHKNEFDVIIVDSSDPVGPAEVLFQEPFYRAASEALTSTGIMVCQGECMWLHLDVIRGVKAFASSLFESVNYGFISIPTYPCGTIGLLCCSKSADIQCPTGPLHATADLETVTKYYTGDLHKAAFCLPNFVRKAIAP